jgi:nucleoside-diphosphate-sugar epimerase
MKRILLTGARGFIGSHTLPLLRELDYEVHAVTSHLPDIESNQIQWHQCDLLDVEQTQALVAAIRPSHLMHFAWSVPPKLYWTSPENTRWKQASFQLLSAFVQHGGQRAVLAGSCAEYEWKYWYLSEFITPTRHPGTLYGQEKSNLRTLCERLANDCSIAWGRIFFTFGQREAPTRLVPSVIQSLLENRPALCTHGKQVRDYLYVEDVADAFVRLLESDLNIPVNIASGRPLTIRALVSAIAEKLNQPELVQFGALPTAKNDPPVLVADVSILYAILGWQPKFSLDDAIEKSIIWWENQLTHQQGRINE